DDSGFFQHELMSGFLSGSNFLSDTTVGHLRDLGFDTIGGLGDLTGVAGDVNQDGFLNLLDFDEFILGWRSNTEGLDAVERTRLGDLNLSGLTDLIDFFILREALNEPGGPRLELPTDLLNVPEPASILLALLGVVSIAASARKRRCSRSG
ncbi:MAG: PEP-CTERM sorting domain-containing protein, partial [Aeoliella sp.]